MQPVNLNRLSYFVAVVETGSFTRAAQRLGITKTVVSQQVARLEDELRTALLSRTTRSVTPTEAGRLLHARSARILQDAGDALGEIAQGNAAPSGHLRVAASNDYGAQVIAPVAAAFTRRYRDCTVELILSDSRLDPVAAQIDLSIRAGWLEDSTLQARRIGSFRQLLVASPDIPAPLTPEDLPERPFIANTALRDPLTWRFAHAATVANTRLSAVLTANTTTATLAMALAGGGMAVLPDYVVTDHLRLGRLIHLLPDWTLPEGGIHAVYPAARFRPPKVTAFVQMLISG
ncbi:MAG: LysR family transcriptional regulator [Paracoccus sp. (in: a-proteobacteria)]|nr:LysR family transcriptional regulator [Paracoccus sp. (in: a-proteobacteria)]